MEAFLAEKQNLKQGILPVDFNAAQAGERISLKKGQRLAIVCSLAASAASVVSPTLKQHNAAVGGTSKDLSVANPYYHKVDTATSYTKVEPTAPAANYVLTSLLDTKKGIVIFEVLAEDLDVNADFDHVSIEFASTTVAKLGSVVYQLHDCKNLPAYTESV